MSKKWTQEEDTFLLTYHGVGADFIASHDLGRPHGAGSRRLEKLTKSGARLAFASAMYHLCDFNSLAGREHYDPECQKDRWEREVTSALAAMERMP